MNKLTRAEINGYSSLAGVDARSIVKLLTGKVVRGDAGERARRVLVAAGLDLPEPQATPAPTPKDEPHG